MCIILPCKYDKTGYKNNYTHVMILNFLLNNYICLNIEYIINSKYILIVSIL